MEADRRTQGQIGAKLSPGVAVIFMLNSLTGLSLLTLPYGFSQAGLLLGAVLLFLCMGLAFVTATFMCEALTIANALTYEEAECQVIKNNPELLEELTREYHSNVVDRPKAESAGASKPSLAAGLLGKHRAFSSEALQDFCDEVRDTNPESEFKIRERVELGQMGEMVLHGKGSHWVATAIYLMVVTFTYGTACALTVTVNTSMAHTYCSAVSLISETSECDADKAYRYCVIVSFCITLPLCFANLQKTKNFTIVIMVFRFIAIAIMIAIGGYKAVGRLQEEGSVTVLSQVPTWEPENFMAVFGNAVFLFGIHHYLPSMISPLEPQRLAPRVIITAFLSCYLVILVVCVTANIAWGGETHSQCSVDLGGHFCKVQTLYNLNFAPLPWLGGSLAIFITAYPSMAIASIPIAAITTRNTMARWLGIVLPGPDNPFTPTNVFMTLAVLMPPSMIALITKDVQAVIQYVGGYAGLAVAIMCPLVLLVRLRHLLKLDTPKEKERRTDRPLKSPFGNRYGYAFVVLFYLVALSLVTKKLFFTPHVAAR